MARKEHAWTRHVCGDGPGERCECADDDYVVGLQRGGTCSDRPRTVGGHGPASLIGGVVPTTGTVLGFASDNGSSDPTPTNSAGAWTSTGYPAQGTVSGTAGLMFAVDCTGCFEHLVRV